MKYCNCANTDGKGCNCYTSDAPVTINKIDRFKIEVRLFFIRLFNRLLNK